MKVCPICQAKAFDDAPVCFGCLHRFADEESESDGAVSDGELGVMSARHAAPMQVEAADARPADARPELPSFLITLMPPSADMAERSWKCSVELVSA